MHEVLISGKNLKRLQIAMQKKELAFIAKVSTSYQSTTVDGSPLILNIVVNETTSPVKQWMLLTTPPGQRSPIRQSIDCPKRPGNLSTRPAGQLPGVGQPAFWQEHPGKYGLSKSDQRPAIRQSFGRTESFCQFANRP
jgi:hypothetical protein